MTENMGKRRWTIFVIGAAVILLAGLLALAWAYYLPLYIRFFKPAHNPKFALELPEVPKIIYMARVNDGFYRGSNPRDNLAALKKLGIRTIINLDFSRDYAAKARASGFQYFVIPMRPDEGPSIEQVRQFLALVNDRKLQPVYVHCWMGIDRTGVMTGIYRIEHDGWSTAQAVEEMNYFGHAPIWHDLGEYLENYRKGMAGAVSGGAQEKGN